MQNRIQKFRQGSIIFEKPRVLCEKLKTLTSSSYRKLNIFSEILYMFSTYQCQQKGARDFFFFFFFFELDLDFA